MKPEALCPCAPHCGRPLLLHRSNRPPWRQARSRLAFALLFSLLTLLMLTGCQPTQPLPTPTPPPAGIIPPGASDEEAILALLQAESRGVVEKDIDLLAAIWSDDAIIIDAKHTPNDPGDDTRWVGLDAVLDRYVTLVFPGNPTFALPADVQITITGEHAEARSSTQIGQERSPHGDQWTFKKVQGQWRITSLTYNLEPASP